MVEPPAVRGPAGDPLDAMLRAGGDSGESGAGGQGTGPAVMIGDSQDDSVVGARAAAWAGGTHSANEGQRAELLARLEEAPWSFDFFQAVRRLVVAHPEKAGFGLSDRVDGDPARFCQQPSMTFAPCTVSRFSPQSADAPARLFVNFMGMLGPNGPLPLHLTEYAYERELHHKDWTFSRFMDLFNHRLVSLFYRAWAVNQMPASFDRSIAATAPGHGHGPLSSVERDQALTQDADRYSMYIGALFGLGADSLRFRDAVPDVAKLHFAGRLCAGTRNPEGLRAILSDYFGVEVEIDEFAGRWVDIPQTYWCGLGGAPGADPAACALGTMSGGGAVAGSRVWDCQGMFRMRLGPMTFKQYQRVLPGSPSHKRLDAWVRNYLGDEFAWEATLLLKADEVPGTRLGGDPAAGGTRLGWTSWVQRGKSEEDRGDLTLRSRN